VAQAHALADNLLAHLAGQPTRAFSHRSKGMMATVGHLKGVAMAFGLPLSGLPAWLLWRAYYLMRLPTLGRKLRIWVEWTWGLVFPLDITHLRFTRTGEEAPVAPALAAGRPESSAFHGPANAPAHGAMGSASGAPNGAPTGAFNDALNNAIGSATNTPVTGRAA
jgi:NADH dehydrogenase